MSDEVSLDDIKRLEKDIDIIKEECCSETIMRERIKTNLMLEVLVKDVSSLHEDKDKILVTLNRHSNYLNMLIGGLMAIEIFGVSDKIKALISG